MEQSFLTIDSTQNKTTNHNMYFSSCNVWYVAVNRLGEKRGCEKAKSGN